MEKEYANLLHTEYFFVRYLGYSMEDLDRMTAEDRKTIIRFYTEEEEAKRSASAGTQEPQAMPDVTARLPRDRS